MSAWHGEQQVRTRSWRNVQYLSAILALLAAFWTAVFALVWRALGTS
jgi:hypothetical protein